MVRACLKINARGLQKLLHIFSIRMLMLFLPWASFELRRYFFAILSAVKVIVRNLIQVTYRGFVGSLLTVFLMKSIG